MKLSLLVSLVIVLCTGCFAGEPVNQLGANPQIVARPQDPLDVSFGCVPSECPCPDGSSGVFECIGDDVFCVCTVMPDVIDSGERQDVVDSGTVDDEGIDDFEEEELPSENIVEYCENGVDDDGDGLVDCDDLDCVSYCADDNTEVECDNGRDDDNDGRTDCNDSDCAFAPNCS